MEIEELLPDMYTMLKDTSEKTAKIGASVSFMETRLSKTEDLLAKMSDTLNEQKLLSQKIDSIQSKLIENTRRIDALERKNISIIKKYAGIFITALVTAAAGFVAVKIGLK